MDGSRQRKVALVMWSLRSCSEVRYVIPGYLYQVFGEVLLVLYLRYNNSAALSVLCFGGADNIRMAGVSINYIVAGRERN